MSIEQAEQLGQNATVNATRSGFEVSTRAGSQVGKQTVASTVAALQAINETLKSHGRGRKKDDEPKQGQVSLKEFTRDVDGRREIVGIEDRKLVNEIRTELKRHGVEFAVEHRGSEQTRYFHVRGDDAGIVAHAIERAQERVDGILARQHSKVSVRQSIDKTMSKDAEAKTERNQRSQKLEGDTPKVPTPGIGDEQKGKTR